MDNHEVRRDTFTAIEPGNPSDDRWIVALSDVHIGDGSPTCWYQSAVHEPYLLAILDWVVAHRDRIDELVLLGDVVDLWTYPFGQRPPTFADIVAANPAVFGADGAIPRVLDALEGRVTWVPGNHDMGISSTEAAIVKGANGAPLRVSSDLRYQPLEADPRLLFAHGHAHTLFNAPDPNSPWPELPSGHFVTRSVAEHWSRHLEPGQTVADLEAQGAPNGLDLKGLATALVGSAEGPSVVGLLFDYLEGALDIDPAERIVMPDGSWSSLAEAREVYVNTWADWAAAAGGGLRGEQEAMRATWGDAMEALAWFAQAEAFRHDADLVVMGHTHGAVGNLDNPMTHYLNTGFECPAVPDLSTDAITFGVIAVNDHAVSGTVWAVSDQLGTDQKHIAPVDAPTEAVVTAGAMDFSCYVDIDNRQGTAPLTLRAASVSRGAFVNEPRPVVAQGARSRVWIKDDLGPFGSAAHIAYERGDGDPLTIEVSCPTGFKPNRCESSAPFTARSGHAEWGNTGEVRMMGHPLFVHVDAS